MTWPLQYLKPERPGSLERDSNGHNDNYEKEYKKEDL